MDICRERERFVLDISDMLMDTPQNTVKHLQRNIRRILKLGNMFLVQQKLKETTSDRFIEHVLAACMLVQICATQ